MKYTKKKNIRQKNMKYTKKQIHCTEEQEIYKNRYIGQKNTKYTKIDTLAQKNTKYTKNRYISTEEHEIYKKLDILHRRT